MSKTSGTGPHATTAVGSVEVTGDAGGAAGEAGAGTGAVADVLVIGDLETLRVLADPLRMRLLETLSREADEEWTVKQLAAALGMTPTKLYYHVNLLEERGLLHVSGSRIVSGIVEKRYRVAARAFRVERGLLSPGGGVDESVASLVTTVIDNSRNEIEDGIRRGSIDSGGDAPPERRMTLSRGFAKLPVARIAEFHERLTALINDFNDDDTGPETRPYGLLLALYPAADLPKPRSRRTTTTRPASKGASS
jgi:DNA-binding transcriptional ArsR family regulator